MTGGAEQTTTRQYETEVNIVDAGADPTGSEPIDDVLAEYNQDDTAIYFPDGEYLIDELILYGRSNFAMVGDGDATLVPGPDHSTDVWIGGADVENLVFEGFTLDHTGDDVHPTVGFTAIDDLVVRDVTKVGYHDGSNTAFGFDISDPDGSGLIENVTMADGSIPEAVATYVATDGELTFRNCHIEGFGNNGLYASLSNGPVHVDGGIYRNNDIAQVRLGSPGSTVSNAIIAVDDPRPTDKNMRGIRISDGPGPVYIDNCDIHMERGPGGGGVVNAYSGGSFVLQNSRIFVGPEYYVIGSDGTATSFAIYVDEPTGIDDPGSRTIERVAITGGGTYRGAAIFMRDHNTIEDVCIHQSGRERNGLVFDDSADNAVVNANIDVPELAITGTGSVDTSDIGRHGTCASPNDGEYDGATIASDGAPPLPPGLGSMSYGTMGTDADNPTLTVYGNFKCPYTRDFLARHVETLRSSFVDEGLLNVRYRDVPYEPWNPGEPYILDDGPSGLVSQYGLGVWDVEPENYWSFVEYLLANRDGLDWTSSDALTGLLQDAGIRNWGKVSVYVDEGYYEAPMQESVAAAADLDVTYLPRLELAGDSTGPRNVRGSLESWVAARL
ncbi:hypothetical protein [Haloarchaeobius baliensis]|uniref:hypothetical protein n=1 Tax=Haloarchaeobius baliensis TaxID=1670458 RepID=UPI003F881543